jgi:hypothetical protein
MPGVLVLLPRCTDAQAISQLETYTMCGNPGDLEGQINYIPEST